MGIVPVIVCGGGGSRLWLPSRESYPKPFIRFHDGFSLIQHALRRAAALPGVREVVTITNRELLFEIRDHYAELDLASLHHRFLLEPEGRDTAAAIAVAALEIESALGPDEVMCILPGDHTVARLDAFVAAVSKAAEPARNGRLVTLGIVPAAPETGYGYIEADGNDVVRFVALMEQHCPDILAACRTSLAAAQRVCGDGQVQVELPKDLFGQVRRQSIDYAVLEKAKGLAVVPCDIGWSDIGSWTAYAGLSPRDAQGNATLGNVVAFDTRNSFVYSGDRLVATLGVEDLVIVDTADALLVASGSRAQDVRKIAASLKAENHPVHREHRKVHRPWGTYTVLETGPRFKIKRIEVKPGGRLSLQMHHHRSEHWVVVAGRARVVNGDRELYLDADQSTYIPSGTRHRLENEETQPLILIEVQTGEYLEEDDIVRFDDVYGRVG